MATKQTAAEALALLTASIDEQQEAVERHLQGSIERDERIDTLIARTDVMIALINDDRTRKVAAEAAESTAAGWLAARLQANAGKVNLLSIILTIILTYLASHYGIPLPLPAQPTTIAPSHQDTPP